MKWYETNYVSHRDWILDHLDLLGLSSDEAVVALMIDFMNEKRMNITVDDIAGHTGMSVEKADETVSLLCAKRYLQIQVNGGNVRFSLSGLFETDVARSERMLDASLFDLFEQEFRRPLSQMEMQKINEWNRTTDRTLIIYALREASAYSSLSMGYIEAVLNSWKQKGITPKMIEEGKY